MSSASNAAPTGDIKTNRHPKNPAQSPTVPTPWRSQSKQSHSDQSRKSVLTTPSQIAPPVTEGTRENAQTLSKLQTARDLANRGNLEEAVTLCKTYLSQHSTCAEGYLLLGEVYQGLGNEEQAEQSFRKAIYLNPNHYEALLHLALLKEQRGDIGSATLIRQRIQRLQQISKK